MSIQVDNLVKSYGPVSVVDNVSFEVAEGEFVSILGPSGCGKTTTLRCIAGLDQPQGGAIRIGGETMWDGAGGVRVPPHNRQVGMVFQSYAVWPHMSVAENVAFPLKARKRRADEIAREVDAALDIVGLRQLKDRHPAQLSGGQQQRVALARAIVGRPRVLLFDEPLSNLDAKLRESTRGEIRRLQRELGVAALYVTHDQEEALSMSDRVILMEGGHIRQCGTPKDLYRRPASRFVADFVGRATFLDLVRDATGGWATPTGDPVRTGSADPPGLTACLAMVRPEHFALEPDGVLPATQGARDRVGDNRLRGRIASAQYLGAYTEYLVEAAGCVLRIHSRRDIDLGQPVAVTFAADDCLVTAP